MSSLHGMRCLHAAGLLLFAANAGASGNPPTVSGSAPTRVIAGQTYSFQPAVTDPENDTITWTVRNKPRWARFWVGRGRLIGTPTAADVGTYANIVIEANDGTNTVGLSSFTITVDPSNVSNARPTITGDPKTSVKPGAWYAFGPSADDPDDHALTYTIGNRPAWAKFNRFSGRLYGRPETQDTGTYEDIKIWVTDGQLARQLPAFTITVGSGTTGGGSAPAISGDPPAAVVVGNTWSLRVNAQDPDDDTLRFSVTNKPDWMTFWSGSGRLFGNPGAADVGWHGEIGISVTDGTSTTRLPDFSIRVDGPGVSNRAPSISGSPRTAVDPGRWYAFAPTATDPDGHALNFSIDNKPSWAKFDPTTGRLYGRPGSGDVGVYADVRIRATDGIASRALPAFTITVGTAPSTGSAVLNWTPPTRNTDGSALTDLDGYVIYHGAISGNYTETVRIWNEGLSTYVVDGLAPGTRCFVVTAFNRNGTESDVSGEVCGTVR